MGMIEDWYDEENAKEAKHAEQRRAEAAADADARASGIFMSVLFFPCIVIFFWKIVSGSFPFGGEVGDQSTLSQVMIGMYIFGAIGTAFLGLILAIFVSAFVFSRLQKQR